VSQLTSLRPDHCNGGFDEYCDSSRKYSNISSILSAFDDTTELLDYMNTYWLANQGSDESLWSHEWNKHGTCISTLDAKCYAEGRESSPSHRYVLDYFNTTVSLFRTLNTYATLAKAGIVPHRTLTWSLDQLQSAFQVFHGVPVTLRCRSGQLDEIWYSLDTRGSIQTGEFVPAAPDGVNSNCPRRGIKYLPKSEPSSSTSSNTSPTSTDTGVPAPTATAPPFTGKGFLHIYVGETQHGCLISSGQWYTSGTCAGFNARADIIDPGHEQLFTLSSRIALCSINEKQTFECSKKLPYQTIFSADSDKLLFKNESVFYADKIPGRFEKINIYSLANGDESQILKTQTDPIKVEVRWVGLN